MDVVVLMYLFVSPLAEIADQCSNQFPEPLKARLCIEQLYQPVELPAILA